MQFKSELLRGVFGEERERGKREEELVVGRFVGEAKWCCRRQQLFNNKFDGSAVRLGRGSDLNWVPSTLAILVIINQSRYFALPI